MGVVTEERTTRLVFADVIPSVKSLLLSSEALSVSKGEMAMWVEKTPGQGHDDYRQLLKW